MVAAYFIHEFLKKKLEPRRSFLRFLIFILANLIFVFVLIFFLSFILFQYKNFFFKQ